MSRADKRPRARLTGFYHRVGASMADGLRPFALPRSHAAGCFLCTPRPRAANTIHKKPNTYQNKASSPASLGLSGRCRLFLLTVLQSRTHAYEGGVSP